MDWQPDDRYFTVKSTDLFYSAFTTGIITRCLSKENKSEKNDNFLHKILRVSKLQQIKKNKSIDTRLKKNVDFTLK